MELKEDEKLCDQCAEVIKKLAVRCRYCDSTFGKIPIKQHPNVIINNSQQQVVQIKKGVSHGFHLFMTLITFGLWLPIWLLCIILD